MFIVKYVKIDFVLDSQTYFPVTWLKSKYLKALKSLRRTSSPVGLSYLLRLVM